MKTLKKNQSGFSAVEVLLVLVIVAMLGFVGWYVWHNKSTSDKTTNTAASAPASTATTHTTAPVKEVDLNAGYLVMKEWGLRFKVPSGLTGVKYAIHGDTAAFYAKPTGSSVQFRSDYDKYAGENFHYAIGVLYRSKDSTNNDRGFATDGKKVGSYYYYTAWSFSGLATGRACVDLYGDSNGDVSEGICKTESVAFGLVNSGDKALLNTIELAQ